VSNLPYSVASPILVELAAGERSPQRIVATLQLEVAKRLMARAGDDDYGLLTLLVQADFEPRDMFKIPAACFFPEPEIDSACVRLDRRTPVPLGPREKVVFVKIVKRAFSQRRKMMFKLLKEDWGQERLRAGFDALGVPLNARAETVDIATFVALTKRFAL